MSSILTDKHQTDQSEAKQITQNARFVESSNPPVVKFMRSLVKPVVWIADQVISFTKK